MNAPSADTSPLNDADPSIDDAVVHSIVEAALRAPSAENTQPWLLKWRDQKLEVRHDRSKKMASDVGSMLDFTGLGALVESLVLASSTHGLSARVETLPAERDSDQSSPVVAVLTFRKSTKAPDPLASFLPKRCTTRRMDPTRQVSREDRAAIATAAQAYPGVRIEWVSNDALPEIAHLTGLATSLRFEYRDFHQEIYSNLRFTHEEATRSCDGLDMATLQLPWGVAGALQFFRKWPRARLANLLGFSRAVGDTAAKEVRRSGAVGFLVVEAPSQEAFLAGGRAFLQAWLEATCLGLAFHPTAALPVFVRHGERGVSDSAPTDCHDRARRLADRFRRSKAEPKGGVLQMMFRVGYGAPPSARTLRKASSEVMQA